MLKAARAQGRPMMVIAMMTAATIQATAIQTPPKTSHSRLSRTDTGDMGLLPRIVRSRRHHNAAWPSFRYRRAVPPASVIAGEVKQFRAANADAAWPSFRYGPAVLPASVIASEAKQFRAANADSGLLRRPLGSSQRPLCQFDWALGFSFCGSIRS